MPRGDGTGPQGLGPMTGRAAGYCAGHSLPGYMNPVPGMGYGFRRGRGRGRGWGRGFGRGFVMPVGRQGRAFYGGYPYGYPYEANVSPKEEADMLREEARAMQEEVKVLNQRIYELEAAEKKVKK